MPIRPNALERALFFSLNLGPAPILDIWGGVAFRVVVAAVRLGIFEALADAPLTARTLADRIGTDPDGTSHLLQAIESLGYVRRRSEAYVLTPMTRKWLLRRSGHFGPGFEFWASNLYTLMGDLEASIRTGTPRRNLYAWIEDQPEVSRAFQEWMVAIAGFAGGTIVNLVARRVPHNAERLLDIGGGHGQYALAFCRRFPRLRATVLDSPRALESARASIDHAEMADRVTTLAGDVLMDPLGEGYDVALMFNVNHGFTEAQNQALVHRTARALRSGGLLVVAEQLSGSTASPVVNATNALLGLSYFHLLGGRLYARDDVARWLTTAGFTRLRRLDSPRLPGMSLMMGVRH